MVEGRRDEQHGAALTAMASRQRRQDGPSMPVHAAEAATDGKRLFLAAAAFRP